jgi:pimeloyl-ACP methyl ester carboxylesterase
MNHVETLRPWRLEMGEGSSLTLILPRMDTAAITEAEWRAVLLPFWNDSRYLILDMPERLMQQEGADATFTVRELAAHVHAFLRDNNLQPDAIWGLSLGGMIAQELSVLPGMEEIPLLLISTNAWADPTLQAVFSNWSLMTEAFGSQAFERCLIPWISQTGQLPVLSHPQQPGDTAANDREGEQQSVAKALASLRAVSLHDARETLTHVKAPTLILFGEHSVLLHHDHADVFRRYLEQAQVAVIERAGMRILGDNPDEAVTRIKSFIGANVK